MKRSTPAQAQSAHSLAPATTNTASGQPADNKPSWNKRLRAMLAIWGLRGIAVQIVAKNP
ncbi:hypothetical protein [Rhizobium sp. 18055]|uniref:hypothetical protein n=1 Tax=Rhizobium sp. 18055 TaxID=2681403 RepID=UPI00135A2600|nr:hypothetical protein [Rhizobium sp. 18055]